MSIFNIPLRDIFFTEIDFATLLGSSDHAPVLEELRTIISKRLAVENLQFVESLFAIHQKSSLSSDEEINAALLDLYKSQIDPKSPGITVNLSGAFIKALEGKINEKKLLTLKDFDPAGSEVLSLISDNYIGPHCAQLKSRLPGAEEKKLETEVKEEDVKPLIINPEVLSKMWAGVHYNLEIYDKEHKKVAALSDFDKALRELEKTIEHFFPEALLGRLFHPTNFKDVLKDEDRFNSKDVKAFLDKAEHFAEVCKRTPLEQGSHPAYIRNDMQNFTEMLQNTLHAGPAALENPKPASP